MKDLVLEQIQTELFQVTTEMQGKLDYIHNMAKEVFEASMVFKTKELNELQKALDESRDLTDVEYDEYVHRWIRYDFSQLIDVKNDLLQGLLKDYLNEHYFIDADFKNDAATTSEGPVIVINDDGDILDQDSGKWIIARPDYSTKEERNALIEAWMTKKGYFPSVVQYCKYGVLGYVSTQVKG